MPIGRCGKNVDVHVGEATIKGQSLDVHWRADLQPMTHSGVEMKCKEVIESTESSFHHQTTSVQLIWFLACSLFHPTSVVPDYALIYPCCLSHFGSSSLTLHPGGCR